MGRCTDLTVLPRVDSRAQGEPKEGRGASRGENQCPTKPPAPKGSARMQTKRLWRSAQAGWNTAKTLESRKRNFLPCSYGFRAGRSAHQALRELFGVITRRGQYWVIEVDVRKYFDSIPHSELRAILDQRVTDGVIRRMIDKWLNAGVLEK